MFIQITGKSCSKIFSNKGKRKIFCGTCFCESLWQIDAILISISNISLRKHAYFKYTENFTIENNDIFHVSAQNIDCGYSLEPQCYYIKVGF